MNERITVSGIIGTDPRKTTTNKGVPVMSFRLASSQSHFDRFKNEWVDEETNWFSVTAYRQLASNAAQSLHKGEHVIVTGRVHVRKWTNAERSGTSVDIEADVVAHDLTWYTTTAVRNGHVARTSAVTAEATEAAEPVESAESAESATAYEADLGQMEGSEDGFVPDATDADSDSFARLDS